MKILLTVHQFFPEYFSGTEVLTFSVARELMSRGHQVSVFTGYPARELMPDSQRFDQYEIEGISVYRFHHAFVPMGEQQVVSEIEYNNHLTAGYFKGFLDELKPDVVHFFHFSRLGTALIDVARKLSIPAYYTPTDFWAVCPTSQLLLTDGQVCSGPSSHGGNCIKHVALLTRWRHYSTVVKHLPDSAVDAVAIMATHGHGINFPFKQEISALSRRKSFNISRLNALQGIVSPTRLMTDVLTGNGVNPELIEQSAYGINVSGFEEFKREYPEDRPITIGYIGTLAPHKGCHILVDAFSKLTNLDACLKIYGNLNEFPDYVADLHAAAKCNDAIEFCGTFPNEQIADVLSRVDVLIVPSVWYENTPLVVYSALAARCPVIASNFPGMSEVVRDGWNGLLFEPNNSEALSACLARLHHEPALLHELSRNCTPPKSIATYVDELLGLYDKRLQVPKHPLSSQQEFAAYVPDNQGEYIAGWAVVGSNAPKRISLIQCDQEIGSTTEFLPRLDVRDGLRNSGIKIKAVNLGFTITLSGVMDKATAILEVEFMGSTKQRIPYASLQAGHFFLFDGGVRLGLDQENLT
ncbi:MAG: glycosyltransferase family 4 protein [Desulfobulbaceae bacterium]|nr:glycosyltransferase family 4 protein [Desulfobulbaceae bacterium]